MKNTNWLKIATTLFTLMFATGCLGGGEDLNPDATGGTSGSGSGGTSNDTCSSDTDCKGDRVCENGECVTVSMA